MRNCSVDILPLHSPRIRSAVDPMETQLTSGLLRLPPLNFEALID